MPTSPRSSETKQPRERNDGRRTLLVYMDAGLIKDLKKAALDAEKNVYEIVEEAARDWLSQSARDSGSSSANPPQRRSKSRRAAT